MCPDTLELSAYFDNELTLEKTAAIQAHLGGCSTCRAVLDHFHSQHRSLIDSDASVPQDPARLERFWTYAGQTRIRRSRAPLNVSVPLPLAVASVLALVAAIFFNFLPSGPNNVPDLLVVETSRPVPAVVSLSIPPEKLDMLLTVLEVNHASGADDIPVLPAELPVVRLGEPQIGRYASQENQP